MKRTNSNNQNQEVMGKDAAEARISRDASLTNSGNHRGSDNSGPRRSGGNRSRRGKGKGANPTGNSSTSFFSNYQYMSDATNYPFTNQSGATLNLSNHIVGETYPVDDTTFKCTTPGIMAFGMAPGVTSDSFDSGLNIAARKLYTFVTSNNSRNSTYDASDMTMYCLATAELMKLWRWAAMVYGVASMYSAFNKYMPDAILKCMHVNPTSLQYHMSNYRESLNVLAAKISSIVLPKAFVYADFEFNKYSAIYADSENTRAQFYLFYPEYYYAFDDAYNDQGSGLKLTEFKSVNSDGLFTWEEIILRLNNVATAILSGSVSGLIAADILKAFGEDGVTVVPQIPVEFTTPIIYDMEMLEQINNIRCMNVSNFIPKSLDVTQLIPSTANTAPYLHCTPEVKITDAYIAACIQLQMLINTNYETLTSDQIINRLMYSLPAVTETAADTFEIMMVSGFCSSISIYTDPAGSAATKIWNNSLITHLADGGYYDQMSQFDNHPLFYSVDGSSSPLRFLGVFGDLKNISVVTNVQAVSTLNAALLALFNV